MIKFKKLIHKETGIVIEYENWEKQFKKNEVIVFPAKELGAYWKYNSNTILFSDDFEIIYDSELSNLELITLYGNCATRETGLKLKRMIDQNQHLRRKYGIEV